MAIWTQYARINLKKVYQKPYSGANTNQINYYVVPVLLDEKRNNVVIHNGSNDITKFNYNNFNAEELGDRIIIIGLKYRYYGVSNSEFSSILKTSNFNISQWMYQINNILNPFCWLNDL